MALGEHVHAEREKAASLLPRQGLAHAGAVAPDQVGLELGQLAVVDDHIAVANHERRGGG